MKRIFFDTSILSEIAWGRAGESMVKVLNKSNLFIDQMDGVLPDFSEEDFTWITSPAMNLEVIGLGGIRQKNNIKNSIFEKRSIQPLRSLVVVDEWKRYISSEEEFVQVVMNRVDTFIENELSQRNLYRQTLKFLRTFPSHENSHFIVAKIKRWAKNVKKDQECYAYFFENIFWDSIFRYPFININCIAERDRLHAMQFWGGIMGVLYRQYYEHYVKRVYLECGPLGFFAEIDRVGSFYNGIAKQRGYDDILRRWDDMVDADSICYALIGKRVSLKKNEPIIVVTRDKKEDVERRLECLYKNLQEVAAKGLKINVSPGRIIFFSPETMNVIDEPLDVQDFINKFDNTESPPLTKDPVPQKPIDVVLK